jgi:methylaspartate mutase sigma subunit
MTATPAAPVVGAPAAVSRRAMDVLITGTVSDSHTWNLVFLQLLFEEMGHRVTVLGSNVPGSLVVAHCLRHRPDLVVVSSLNGHGYPDGLELIGDIRAHGALGGLPVIIGGKLGITGEASESRARRLTAAGFDAVFEDTGGGVTMHALRAFVGRIGARAGDLA